MRYKIHILMLVLLATVLFSCERERGGVGPVSDISTITFNAAFAASRLSEGISPHSTDGSILRSGSVITKSNKISFEDGDRIGVYLTKGDLDLRSSFNALDNKLFAYFASGDSLSGVPTSAFYPDKITPVAMYAYYPFMPSMTNALAIPFRVTSDVKANDLCYASLAKQAPSASALKLTFSHSLAKLLVNINFDDILSKVESIKSITVRDVKDSCYLNLKTGVVTTSSGSIKDITTTSTGLFILPAQSLATGRTIDVICKAKAGASDITLSYYSSSASPVVLTAGYSHTINLIAADDKHLMISDRTVIEAWTESATSSTLAQSADNHFTLHWLIPDSRHAQTKDVVLNIRDSRNGLLSPYTATNLVIGSGNDNLKASFTFDLKEPSLGYPYSIESITFLDTLGVVVQDCKSITAANVYRSGDLTIGLQQDNILTITTGTITNWNGENLGGIISGGGVSNVYALSMYEPLTFAPSLDYTKIASITLTIDNATYTFSGAKLSTSPTSNVMIATINFSLPDDSGRTPISYPYTIEGIVLKNSAGAVLSNSYCDIAVSSGASVNLNLYKGGKVELATEASISAWGAGTLPSGEIIYTGPLSSNALSVVYCNGGAIASNACTYLNKVELTTAAGVMTLSPYTMAGTRFAASSTGSVDVATATGVRPTNYPYSITKVRLIKIDGTVLETITPATPIWVYQSGAIQFQIMK